MHSQARSRRHLLPWTLLVLGLLHQTACASRTHPVEPSHKAPRQEESTHEQGNQGQPETEGKPEVREPEDEENTWPNRLLAAPESAWAGLAYPFKKLAIAYERYDLLNRALDLFLNQERTAGVYPKFAIGGTLSSGVGFTAFNNNLFRRGKRHGCPTSWPRGTIKSPKRRIGTLPSLALRGFSRPTPSC